MTLANDNFNNNIIPALMAPPAIIPYAVPHRTPSVLAALVRNGTPNVDTIDALLQLPIFLFSNDEQRGIAINMLHGNFVTLDGIIEMYETKWSSVDNFRTRLRSCNIPEGLAIILVNGFNLLVN
jgi:hypothetical protein